MRKLVTAFLGVGGIGIIAGILFVLKWGIFYFDRLNLFFSLSISGILVIMGFFGAWVIKTFDDYKNRSRDYKKEIDGKIDDLEKDLASISNRLMYIESVQIGINDKEFDKSQKLNKGKGIKKGRQLK